MSDIPFPFEWCHVQLLTIFLHNLTMVLFWFIIRLPYSASRKYIKHQNIIFVYKETNVLCFWKLFVIKCFFLHRYMDRCFKHYRKKIADLNLHLGIKIFLWAIIRKCICDKNARIFNDRLNYFRGIKVRFLYHTWPCKLHEI